MRSMTVKEMKEVLNSFPDDSEVFLSSDEEGNNYHAISKSYSFTPYDEDKALIIYPGGQWFDIDEIAPSVLEEI